MRAALLDSMGRLITELAEDQRPGTVGVAIMTDGHENSSKEWTRPAIKSLVEQQTEQYNWQFLYMGADQDAIEVGTAIGVSADHSVTYSRGRAREAMAATSAVVSGLRRARKYNPNAAAPAYTQADRDRLGD